MGVARAAGGVVMEDIEIDAADPTGRCRGGREALELEEGSQPDERLEPKGVRIAHSQRIGAS